MSLLTAQQRQRLLVISACLLMTVAGQSMSGAVYADFLLTNIGMTHLQVEIAMATVLFGGLMSFVSSVAYERLGPRWSILISGLLSSASCGLLALAFAHLDAVRSRVWLLNLLLFVYGHSFNYGVTAAFASTLGVGSSFGTVVTLLDTCFVIGTPAVALLYFVGFGNADSLVQSPIGTMATLACINAFAHAFAFCFISADAGKHSGETQPILDEAGESDKSDEQELKLQEAEEKSKPLKQLLQSLLDLFSLRYCLALSGFALVQASCMALMLNVTTISRSLGLSHQNLLLFLLPAGVSIAWRWLLGPATEKFAPEARQKTLVMLASAGVFGTIGCVLLTLPLLMPALATLLLSYSMLSLSSASVFILHPTILAIDSTPKIFSRMYTGCVQLTTALALPLLLQFGYIFQLKASAKLNCSQAECYSSATVAIAVSHTVGLACLATFAVVVWRGHH